MALLSLLTGLVKLLCGGGGSGTQQPPQEQQPQHQHSPQHKPPQHAHQPAHQGGAWQQQQHAPSPPPSSPPQHKPHGHGQIDANQANQHDPHYMALRANANKEGDAMGDCFSRSKQAYERGDGAGAKQLSNQGKEHQARMQQFNKEASDWIFRKNNEDSGPTEIDLHGLYVREAVEHTDRALEEAKRRGDQEVRLIVGKGLHSQGHVAKVKPAIEELMQKYGATKVYSVLTRAADIGLQRNLIPTMLVFL
ncbi:Smr domain-containing protein [Mycena kentingensis (nom. inval.)]|nr:Smr domain-containing protein [Mycena kentingensis (nom. inval.)]